MAIDYGNKRTGIAVTDPEQIIARPLQTVRTHDLLDFLIDYTKQENVESIVTGIPKHLNGTENDIVTAIRGQINRWKKHLPEHIRFYEEDERFTSKMAMQSLVQSGMKKKDRAKKENIDQVSAALILQTFMSRTASQTNPLI